MNRDIQTRPGAKRENIHLNYLKTVGILIIAVVVITLFLPGNAIDVEVGDDRMAVVCTSGNILGHEDLARAEVVYDEIADLELVDTVLCGEFVEGYAGRRGIGARYDAGVWTCPEYGGEYDVILREDSTRSIRVTETDGHTILFNFESSESTENLYNALCDYLGR